MGVETYRGLRYAEPPLRFRSSVVAASPWQGVYDATRFKAMAVQSEIIPEVYGPAPEAAYSEDCLLLNIHVPQAPVSAPRPVIFFIHGGSFTGGASSAPPTHFAPIERASSWCSRRSELT